VVVLGRNVSIWGGGEYIGTSRCGNRLCSTVTGTNEDMLVLSNKAAPQKSKRRGFTGVIREVKRQT
jgi:hypothetical protein